MNSHSLSDLSVSATELEAHVNLVNFDTVKGEEMLRERLGVPVDLSSRFPDISALYKKIFAILTGERGRNSFDSARVITHVVMKLKQGDREHRVVDENALGDQQTLYAGNVWVGPELADYKSLETDPPISGLPTLPEGEKDTYRILAGSSYANAIVHTRSGKVAVLHPHDLILEKEGEMIIGTPVSEIVAERMLKYIQRMQSIVRK